jgi:hypothetical protein
MQEIKITVGEELFSFRSYDDWCNTAQHRFADAGVGSKDTLCVDANGRVCLKGAEFTRAREEEAFPVRVYLSLCS